MLNRENNVFAAASNGGYENSLKAFPKTEQATQDSVDSSSDLGGTFHHKSSGICSVWLHSSLKCQIRDNLITIDGLHHIKFRGPSLYMSKQWKS